MKSVLIKTIILLCSLSIVATIFFPIIARADISSYVDDIGNNDGDDLGNSFTAAEKIIGTILNIVRIVGAAVAVIILLVIATKYIVASAGDRADIKKYAINYVIGALIFLGASGILTIIRDFILEG